ncbi:MAG TPA: hypothetical protein VHG28_08595 [Longimicrobiaceae bacterium]|nr:hypothetical protein [Longimicrobiaceae bacterium]
MYFKTGFAVVCAVLLAGACDSALAPGGRRIPGILEWEVLPAVTDVVPLRALASGSALRAGVVAPDTVQAGVVFAIRVTTIGPTLCWEAAGAVVELEPDLATVTPYDRTHEDEDTGCADARAELSRRVELRFTRKGETLLRVRGRRVVGRGLQEAEGMVVLEKRIQVR